MNTLHIYKAITITHRQAKLQDIGKYIIPNTEDDAALAPRLHKLQQDLGIDEMLYLSTCNRVLFFFVQEEVLDTARVSTFFRTAMPQLTDHEVEQAVRLAQVFQGPESIQHLFEVAASVDSLVVGEREILRQLRQAYDRCANTLKTTGDAIRLAMRFTVEAAKKVYSETRIGEKPISVVSLAMQQLSHHHIAQKARFLMVGAGQTNRLVSKFLAKYDYQNTSIFNRTPRKAEALAQLIGGNAKGYAFDELPKHQKGFDVLIVCTGSTEAVITPDLYQTLLQGETTPKVVIDLSIPNNVAAEVVQQYPIDYIEIEGLRQLAEQNLAFRRREVSKAKAMLEAATKEYQEHFKARQITLALRDIPVQIKEVRSHAMNNVFRNEIDELDDKSKELVERMLTYMERRCIGIPMKVAQDAFLKS